MNILRGERKRAAYPIWVRDKPAWQGVIVREPDDYLWRCPHVHLEHEDAVRCAIDHDELAEVEREETG